MQTPKILRLILGDQLTHSLSALEGIDVDNDVVLSRYFDTKLRFAF